MSAWLWWLLAALALRTYLVHEWRLRRINEIHFYNMAWLYREQSGNIDTSHYRKLGSARAMLLDLRRWSYRAFYPVVLDPDTRIRAERAAWLKSLRLRLEADRDMMRAANAVYAGHEITGANLQRPPSVDHGAQG